ncbi:MAG: T9SS type A sorting domain-containing protein, partial [Chitinophagaceae bacterium]|nr:T9SS type A sorting domain-containing protein [Chitinophagaceae bacterium]
PTYQNVTVCNGNNQTLTGNIGGGVPPLTYSWLPVTGLNNTNTNTVSFTATTNISYTLTVTDQLGQVAKDTFNIDVQNPIPPANITSQFPLLCDTMELYTNNGIPGAWYYVVGNYLYPPPGQFGGNGLIQTIIQPGRYMYRTHNSCGWRYDSIDVAAVLTTVTANVTDDTICEGQSVIFNGSGALSYTWTNGVTDNVPFTPAYTPYLLNYIVTGSDANGCLGKDTVGVRVYQNVNVTTNLSICANQTPYVWNGQNLDSTGVYTANFISVNGCDSIATLSLTVSPCIVCVPNFTINYSPFYNSLTESQSWIISSGTVLIKAGTNVKLDANANSYVTLNPGFKADSGSVFIAQAYNGCTAGAPQLPNAKIFTGEAIAANEIVLYPNPTNGMIHIRHDEKLTGIQVFDMVGKLVINQKCNGETETNIDLSTLPYGVYHVKAAGSHSVKVVKSN